MTTFVAAPAIGVGSNLPASPVLGVEAIVVIPAGEPVLTNVFSNPLNVNYLAQPTVTSTPI